MNQEQYLGLFRDFLKLLGGALVTNGIVTTADWTTWTGVLIAAAPIGWSVYEKTKARMIARVDAMPEVAGVVTKSTPEGKALAAENPSPTVAMAGSVQAEMVARAA